MGRMSEPTFHIDDAAIGGSGGRRVAAAPAARTAPRRAAGSPAASGSRTDRSSGAASGGLLELTPEGVRAREARLAELNAERNELSMRLRVAREGGSSADDSEWEDVRERQAQVEAHILRINQEIRTARIVDPSELRRDTVVVGMAVKLVDPANPDAPARIYAIVGDGESNPARKRITAKSPIGQQLMGRHVGDEIAMKTPKGTLRYRIAAIAPAPVG